jgi:hypothetical protein
MNECITQITEQAKVFADTGTQLSDRLLEWRDRMIQLEDEIDTLRQEDVFKARAIGELEDMVLHLQRTIEVMNDSPIDDDYPDIDEEMKACCDAIDDILAEEDYVPMSGGLTDDEFYTLMDATVMNLPVDIYLMVEMPDPEDDFYARMGL